MALALKDMMLIELIRTILVKELLEKQTISIDEFCRKYNIDRSILDSATKRLEQYLTIDSDSITLLDRVGFAVESMKLGIPAYDIVKLMNWREYEALCSKILSTYGFKILRNIRFSVQGKRFEVDIVAIRSPYVLIIDCKQWLRLKGRSTALLEAIMRHKERFESFLKVAPEILRLPIKIVFGLKFIPVLITFYTQDQLIVDGVIAIPLEGLSRLIVDLENLPVEYRTIDKSYTTIDRE